MKRFCPVLILVTLILCVLSSCKNSDSDIHSDSEASFNELTSPATEIATGQQASDSPPSSESAQETSPIEISPLSVYKGIFQNEKEIFSIDANQNLGMTQLAKALTSDSSLSASVIHFAVIDLDNDGIQEVVLRMKLAENDTVGSIVLSYQDDTVYGYTLFIRQFDDLKVDGTFRASGSAGNYGICSIEFDKHTYAIDRFTYRDDSSFCINHQSSSEEAFNTAMNIQDEKQSVEWYDFTEDNIEKVFR